MDVDEMYLAKEAVNRVATICTLLAEPCDDNLPPALEATAELQQLLRQLVEAHSAASPSSAYSIEVWPSDRVGLS